MLVEACSLSCHRCIWKTLPAAAIRSGRSPFDRAPLRQQNSREHYAGRAANSRSSAECSLQSASGTAQPGAAVGWRSGPQASQQPEAEEGPAEQAQAQPEPEPASSSPCWPASARWVAHQGILRHLGWPAQAQRLPCRALARLRLQEEGRQGPAYDAGQTQSPSQRQLLHPEARRCARLLRPAQPCAARSVLTCGSCAAGATPAFDAGTAGAIEDLEPAETDAADFGSNRQRSAVSDAEGSDSEMEEDSYTSQEQDAGALAQQQSHLITSLQQENSALQQVCARSLLARAASG